MVALVGFESLSTLSTHADGVATLWMFTAIGQKVHSTTSVAGIPTMATAHCGFPNGYGEHHGITMESLPAVGTTHIEFHKML